MKNPLNRFDTVGFISNILAVILGIVITFSIQSIIDNKKEKENVNSALQLVRDELQGCKNDLMTCADMLNKEWRGSIYLTEHKDHLKDCPKDSVSLYGSILISELILTLPDDALELLKNSSLFQSIGDNELALKIIRAYDQCNASCQVFNSHEKQKMSILEEFYSSAELEKAITEDGIMKVTELLKTSSGKRAIMLLSRMNGYAIEAGFPNIDEAISSIDAYLNK